MAVHGSLAAYRSGCRCPLCKQANSEYMAEWRQGRRGTHSNPLGGFLIAAARPDDPAGHSPEKRPAGANLTQQEAPIMPRRVGRPW